MSELDLSKAVEAGARVLTGQILVSDYDDLNPQTRHAFDCDAERIIWATLPHLLDALASQAHCERVFAGSFPPVKEDAYIVAQWLHTKAEEART